MFGLPLAFATPWLLLALVGLPILWILLRAVPPAPIRRRFPGVVLLLGLKDDESSMDRTPWWLLLLRMLVLAFAVIGLAGPLLNPQTVETRNAPLLVMIDGSWAQAAGWSAQVNALESILAEADRAGRDAALLRLTTPEMPDFQPAGNLLRRLPDFAPQPWLPTQDHAERVIELTESATFDTLWVSDGLGFQGRDALVSDLQSKGQLEVLPTGLPVAAIRSVEIEEGALATEVLRAEATDRLTLSLSVLGADPNGIERTLARSQMVFEPGESAAQSLLSLPSELRSRITRFEIDDMRSAGAVFLTDDSIRRREIALITNREQREGLELLSPTHYLRQALVETADLIEASVTVAIPANPDVVVLADVANLAPAEEDLLIQWVSDGGLLLRFAGPQLADSDLSRTEEHPLMPVRLRAGGRSVGGAMSWGEPKELAPFAQNSPFYGLKVPQDLRVTAQVVAQPDPNLAGRVLAELADGTPLVTRKQMGAGQVVLFHVTANAEWSVLPLSGLFVQMLDRLAVLSAVKTDQDAVLEGTVWQPIQVMDAYGALQDGQTLPGVKGQDLATGILGQDLRPGLYQSQDRAIARNALRTDQEIVAASWPQTVPILGLENAVTRDLTGAFLVAAIVLLLADTLASLALSGRLRGLGLTASLCAALLLPFAAEAQTANTDRSEIALAYVETGDASVDDISRAGLQGLSRVLFTRTSIEPTEPQAINLETTDLTLVPFLYWPISTRQPIPSDEAYARLNQYLRTGGMILFDTRDADVAGFGTASPNGRKLQQLAQPLDIPKLERVPRDHVLTRTFYLMQDFPGRYNGRDVWVEAAPPDAELVEGMPFRNLNDGVTPVVIGGNDWASAWATDAFGLPRFQVGRGVTGERQRELSYRFGVNLIMHVLTGNYKSDQVHVPALLDRLGQ